MRAWGLLLRERGDKGNEGEVKKEEGKGIRRGRGRNVGEGNCYGS